MSNEVWARALIDKCTESRQRLEAYRAKVRSRDSVMKDSAVITEDKVVGGMIGELDFAVRHMQRYVGQARTPKPTRLDRKLFPSLDIEPERRLSGERREIMLEILSTLSVREQQCILLYAAHGMSLAAIGKELGVSKAMVQQSISRAKTKIEALMKRFGNIF